MDREGRIEPDLHRVIAKEFRANRVECTGPGYALSEDAGFVAQRLGADAFDPPGHLGSGPP